MDRTAENPYLDRQFRARCDVETTASTCRSPARSPPTSTAATCATAQPGGPRRPGPPPLVPRRGHGPRRPPARREGRVVPQPLRALGRRRPGARRAAPARARVHAGFDFAANTNVIVQAGRTLRHRRGRRPALRAHRRARHDRRLRLRRHAARRLHRPPASATRTPASSTPCPTTGGGATRCSTPWSAPTPGSGAWSTIEVTGSPMMHDFALTESHVVVRSAIDLAACAVRPRTWCDATGVRGSCPVAAGTRRLTRRSRTWASCPGGTGDGGADVRVVRRRALLRLPPAQRLRRRRPDRRRRRAATRRCSTPTASAPTRARRRSTGGRSTCRPARSSRTASTTAARSSPASTSGSSGRRHRYGYTVGGDLRRCGWPRTRLIRHDLARAGRRTARSARAARGRVRLRPASAATPPRTGAC